MQADNIQSSYRTSAMQMLREYQRVVNRAYSDVGSVESGLNRSRARSTLSHRPLLPEVEIFREYCGAPTGSSYLGPPRKEDDRSDENVNSPHG